MTTSLDKLLDVHAAAEMLAIKPSTLYQWAYQQRIPKVKLFGPRGALRFRLSDVEKLIARSVQPMRRPLTDPVGRTSEGDVMDAGVAVSHARGGTPIASRSGRQTGEA
jgi:predicted DNA-binding transcriptional regulator AlpA